MNCHVIRSGVTVRTKSLENYPMHPLIFLLLARENVYTISGRDAEVRDRLGLLLTSKYSELN